MEHPDLRYVHPVDQNEADALEASSDERFQELRLREAPDVEPVGLRRLGPLRAPLSILVRSGSHDEASRHSTCLANDRDGVVHVLEDLTEDNHVHGLVGERELLGGSDPCLYEMFTGDPHEFLGDVHPVGLAAIGKKIYDVAGVAADVEDIFTLSDRGNHLTESTTLHRVESTPNINRVGPMPFDTLFSATWFCHVSPFLFFGSFRFLLE